MVTVKRHSSYSRNKCHDCTALLEQVHRTGVGSDKKGTGLPRPKGDNHDSNSIPRHGEQI